MARTAPSKLLEVVAVAVVVVVELAPVAAPAVAPASARKARRRWGRGQSVRCPPTDIQWTGRNADTHLLCNLPSGKIWFSLKEAFANRNSSIPQFPGLKV
jgi:hypothetical protein